MCPLAGTAPIIRSRSRRARWASSRQGTAGPGARFGARRGFTIVELMMTLAIIATLSAIAAPKMMGAESRWRVRGAAQRIAADMERARSIAFASSSTVTLTFSRDRYALSCSDAEVDAAEAMSVQLFRKPYHVRIVKVDLSKSLVRFDGAGTASAGGSVYVSDGFHVCEVRLDAGTSRPTLGELRLPTASEKSVVNGSGK